MRFYVKKKSLPVECWHDTFFWTNCLYEHHQSRTSSSQSASAHHRTFSLKSRAEQGSSDIMSWLYKILSSLQKKTEHKRCTDLHNRKEKLGSLPLYTFLIVLCFPVRLQQREKPAQGKWHLQVRINGCRESQVFSLLLIPPCKYLDSLLYLYQLIDFFRKWVCWFNVQFNGI